MSTQGRTNILYTTKWKDAILCGEETVAGDGEKSLCQCIYEALGNSKKVLVTLCHGQTKVDGTPLIDLEESPWRHEPKGTIKPANKDLAMEVLHRQKLFSDDGGDRKSLTMKPINKQ